MEITVLHVLGCVGAVLAGVVLGLLGGGGALFTTPVLVYLFNLDAVTATGYSLFLVGVTAMSGAFRNLRKDLVDYHSAIYYGIPSILVVYMMRRFVVPALPKVILQVGGYTVDKDHFILTLLAIAMFTAAYKMITAGELHEEKGKAEESKLVLYALLSGMFFGMVGVGGGFLITPVLVHFAHLKVKNAVATSLLIVAANSFIGFSGDVSSNQNIDWKFLAVFAGFSISGVVLGSYLSESIDGAKLRKNFGWFMVLVALWIIVKETFLK